MVCTTYQPHCPCAAPQLPKAPPPCQQVTRAADGGSATAEPAGGIVSEEEPHVGQAICLQVEPAQHSVASHSTLSKGATHSADACRTCWMVPRSDWDSRAPTSPELVPLPSHWWHTAVPVPAQRVQAHCSGIMGPSPAAARRFRSINSSCGRLMVRCSSSVTNEYAEGAGSLVAARSCGDRGGSQIAILCRSHRNLGFEGGSSGQAPQPTAAATGPSIGRRLTSPPLSLDAALGMLPPPAVCSAAGLVCGSWLQLVPLLQGPTLGSGHSWPGCSSAVHRRHPCDAAGGQGAHLLYAVCRAMH